MNINKNAIASKFRNILPDVFFGRYGFWICIASIFLVQAILYFVFVFSLPAHYAKTYQDLVNLIPPLENYAVRVKNIYNDKWITSKQLEADLSKKELEKCKAFLQEKDSRLESYFTVEDPEKGAVKIEDEALWKNDYIKRASALLRKLETRSIAWDEDTFPFYDWGSDIPTREAILQAQKQFWILEAVVYTVANTPGTAKLGKIRFRETSFTYDASFAQIYTAIPVTLQLELQANRLLFLLREIQTSNVPFVIEDVNILSTEKTLKPAKPNEAGDSAVEDAESSAPIPIIDMKIHAYVIDYKS